MKKIVIMLFALVLLWGCSSHQEATTFMLTRDDVIYALYNSDGKKLTDYLYKTYQEVSGIGYIVTNEQDEVGLISLKGKEMIACGEYETLVSSQQMLMATKKVEKKDDDKKEDTKEKKEEVPTFVNANLYVLKSNGKVLYEADEKIAIMASGLPVLKQGDEYIVLYNDGDELYKGEKAVLYAYCQDSSIIIGFEDGEKIYYPNVENKKELVELNVETVGHYQFLLGNDKGALLYDKTLKSMLYVQYETKKTYVHELAIDKAYYDDGNNIILESNKQLYIYAAEKEPTRLTSYYNSAYTYLVRSKDIYGPHQIYKESQNVGQLEDCQLYPSPQLIYADIFPVYIMNKGYVYYNYDGKRVIDTIYMEAEPFDDSRMAIVKVLDDGYSLIDEKGKVITNDTYDQIKYIGNLYYVVYNEIGVFGVIDKDGKEILPLEYTSLPEEPLIQYDGDLYLHVVKNGRSYVYNTSDKMKEVFSVEGELTYHDQGYFSYEHQYYTIEGEVIE